MLKHVPYSSIENHYRLKFIKQIQSLVAELNPNTQFVATEKVHGSNLQFLVSKRNEKQKEENKVKYNIQLGKRTSLLNEKNEKSFYPKALEKVKSENSEFVTQVYEEVLKLYRQEKKGVKVNYIIIFGELYGGVYPQKESQKEKSNVVQRGVFYTPENFFYPFDICCNQIKDGEKEKNEYLPYCQFEKIMKTLKRKIYAKPLKIGTFKECFDYNIRFNSTIPDFHDLPKLDDNSNLSEGIVIKPYSEEIYTKQGRRIMVKKKNDEFKEVKPKVFKPQNSKRKKKWKKKKKGSQKVEKLFKDVKRYITRQRLDSVISKIGMVEWKDYGVIIVNLMDDVIDEYEKDNEKWKDGLTEKEVKEIKAKININGGEYFNEKQKK